MQQRQLRLGDTLDDYCPRERRLANHTIVAMVGDDIRLTRCTTCDNEHPYKGGKMPRLRKKKTSVEAAYDEVLESVKQETQTPATAGGLKAGTPGEASALSAAPTFPASATATEDDMQPEAKVVQRKSDTTQASPNGDAPAGHPNAGAALGSPAAGAPEEVRLHRPLIRAQLPRVEREAAARPAPEFTIHQTKRQGRFQNSRPARFAKAGDPAHRQGSSRGPGGPAGGRQGSRPHGHGSPARPHHGRPGPHPGKKRSR
jgi:hypothetical protein